jgi:hypothetical protein
MFAASDYHVQLLEAKWRTLLCHGLYHVVLYIGSTRSYEFTADTAHKRLDNVVSRHFGRSG